MALVKTKISKSLEDFLISLQDSKTLTKEDKAKIKKYADGFSDWLIESVKSATITVNSGIPVLTAGGPAAQTGATTAPGTTTIS